MYYIAQTASEYNKLAGFVNNILLAATFLATVFGIHLTIIQLFFVWLIIMLGCYVSGRVIVTMGITAYNAQLGNEQNPEIMEIVEWVREQREKEKNGTK